MSDYLNSALYGWYPYICLTVFALGSLVRFDMRNTPGAAGESVIAEATVPLGLQPFPCRHPGRDCRAFRGFLMPDWAVDWLISPAQHELLAMVVGGLAGLIAIIGLSLLIHRRLTDPRNGHQPEMGYRDYSDAVGAVGSGLMTVPV